MSRQKPQWQIFCWARRPQSRYDAGEVGNVHEELAEPDRTFAWQEVSRIVELRPPAAYCAHIASLSALKKGLMPLGEGNQMIPLGPYPRFLLRAQLLTRLSQPLQDL